MHQARQFPGEMRPFTITRRQVFTASLPLFAKVFAAILAVLILIDLIRMINAYGAGRVFAHFGHWFGQFLIQLLPVYLMFALLCLFIYRQACKQKVIDIPVRYGYDEYGVYFDDVYGTACYAWEIFNTWKETSEFILLNDGVRRILWPKTIWSENELKEQRALMREKISPLTRR